MQSSFFTKAAFVAILIMLAIRVPSDVFAKPVAAELPAVANTATPDAFSDPLMGTVTMFAGTFAPRGWMKCEGQLLPISQYSALFSILGTTYGGDGRTTFALPDLRGRVPMGTGTGPALAPVRLGEKKGVEFMTLTTAQIPSHNHSATVTLNAGNVDAGIKANASDRILMSSGRGGTPIYTDQPATAKLRQDAASAQVMNTGGNQAFDNKQPSLGITYIIAVQGIFPSRN